MNAQIRLLLRARILYLAAHRLAAQRDPAAHCAERPTDITLTCGCSIARKFRLAQAKRRLAIQHWSRE